MSIWNKVLVGLIGVTSLVLFCMAGLTLKIHQEWGGAAVKFEARIKQVQQENDRLRYAVDSQLRLELERLVADRSRAWFNCDAKVKVNPADGTAAVTVSIDQPEPSGIAKGTVLYGFEQAGVQKKGRYLGEFKATGVNQKQVDLAPCSRLSPREADALAAAKGPWVLYEVMPRDNHEVFAALGDKELEAMLPRESVEQYIKGDKSARPVRDYQVLLNTASLRHTLLMDRISAAAGDNKLVDEALVLAKKQEEDIQQDLALAKEEVKKSAGEQDAVAAYRKALQQELDAVKAAVAQLIESNQAMAGQLAKLQFEAARRIDQRTRAMAQSGTGSL
jgi:hypothetical protein